MGLEQEIKQARNEITSDGYDMSFGEVMNLYKDGELIINPEFQRLFRWSLYQKSKFIESILLGIPIPPIFVFQNEDGLWELIDGLQRLSTVFEFAGILRKPDGGTQNPSVLTESSYLPSLAGKSWNPSKDGSTEGIGKTQQIEIKRARIRVEILKKESDPRSKYELFQRLNTGGSNLTRQEVRNCTAIMLNKEFHNWLVELANYEPFRITTKQTGPALKKQMHVELALRFIAFRNIEYLSGLDYHDYLDEALNKLIIDESFLREGEGEIFRRTFSVIQKALGINAFRKWDGNRFQGKFLISIYEVFSTGVSLNIDSIEEMAEKEQKNYLTEKAKELWNNEIFVKNSGAGVAGSTRLATLIPLAKEFFRQ